MAYRAKLIIVNIFLFVMLSLSLERQGHAYVDPGSSLLLFQSFSAVVSAGLFYFRRRIKALFISTFKTETSSAPSDSSVSEPR